MCPRRRDEASFVGSGGGVVCGRGLWSFIGARSGSGTCGWTGGGDPGVLQPAEAECDQGRGEDAGCGLSVQADTGYSDVCANCESHYRGAAAYVFGAEWNDVRSEERAERYGGQGD